MAKSKLSIVAAVLVFGLASVADAHFIWLAPKKSKDGQTTVQVYFGEDASPDDPALLARVKSMTMHRVRGEQQPVAVPLKHSDESLSAKINDYKSRSLFIATHDLGVFERGDSRFRLMYYAKGGPPISNKTWQKTQVSDDLKLDLIPSVNEASALITVHFDGKPAVKAQVVASGPGLEDFEGETDENGRVQFEFANAGMYSIRARHIDPTPGELNGKNYPETRHYVTAAVRVPKSLAVVKSKDVATVPEEVTSFGAAISGGALYTYGGHTGGAHSYSKEEQNNSLRRMDLKTGEWKTLVEGPHLQGLALVAHGDSLYRIGGFTAKNSEGEEHDLKSQPLVARFDIKAGTWEELPPLPEPRSSHDAAVVGDAIYVVGGWNMADGETRWHTTAWKLDLKNAKSGWQSFPDPPFQRRALALAAYGEDLYVVGGMQEKGGPSRRVDRFDTESNTWKSAPELVGDDGMTGFGASAFATGGQLYVTTVKGTLQQLAKDGSQWKVVGRTPTPRFFHRLLSVDAKHLLVVGGANMETGKFDAVELLTVTR